MKMNQYVLEIRGALEHVSKGEYFFLSKCVFMVPSKVGIFFKKLVIYRWKKMPQNDSVNPFTKHISLHGNFRVSLDEVRGTGGERGRPHATLMENIYFFP